MGEWFSCLVADKLPPGRAAVVEGPDGQDYAVYNADGTIYCSENGCLHQGGPLGQGHLEGNCVSCLWHGWEFDVTSGECLEMPGESIQTFPARIAEGVIQIQL